jgi:hypothetical protein
LSSGRGARVYWDVLVWSFCCGVSWVQRRETQDCTSEQVRDVIRDVHRYFLLLFHGLWWIRVWGGVRALVFTFGHSAADGAFSDRLMLLGRGVCCGYGLSFCTALPSAFPLVCGLDGCVFSRFGFLNWDWPHMSPSF